MEPLSTVLNALLPLLYLGLAGTYALLLARDHPRARRVGPAILRGTVVLHLGAVVLAGIAGGRHPVGNRSELLSLVALAVAASYAWVEARRRNPYTGVFPLSLAFALQAWSWLARVEQPVVPEILKDPLFAWHSGAAAVAMAALSVGAVYGVLFLVMYRLLKVGLVGEFAMRMPSLDVLADMSLHAVEVGFVALTLAVGLGDIWVSRTPGMSLADPKVWATFAVWAVYGGALAGRFLAKWGGWRVVALNLTGYGLLLGSMLLIGRVVGTFHRFPGGGP
ncbi:MAG TPA: cytochrome c biogenesis protein CcsA [Planctomycetota bacterium]|nr:cytochrome c biogenesis protein CcsA [Planctomycetota bacterium]